MRLRRWFYAIASVFVVALVMFPLNLLWVGQSPLHAAVSSLLFGLPALLTAWTPKGRCAGGRAESRATNPVGLPCARNPADVPEPASMPHLPGVLTPPRMPGPPCQPGVQAAANPPVMPGQWEGANPPVVPALKGLVNPLRIRNPAVALRPRTASNPPGGNPCCRKPRWAAMLAYDIVTEGVAVGVTKSVGFVLLILVAALGSRLGYLKF